MLHDRTLPQICNGDWHFVLHAFPEFLPGHSICKQPGANSCLPAVCELVATVSTMRDMEGRTTICHGSRFQLVWNYSQVRKFHTAFPDILLSRATGCVAVTKIHNGCTPERKSNVRGHRTDAFYGYFQPATRSPFGTIHKIPKLRCSILNNNYYETNDSSSSPFFHEFGTTRHHTMEDFSSLRF